MNIGFHGLDVDAPNPHGPGGPLQLGRNLEWSGAIADVITLHCNNAPPEVAVDALGIAAAQLADAIVNQVDTSAIADQMRDVLCQVVSRVFHHDPMHTLLGLSIICSASAGKYVERKYPPRDPTGMH